MLRKQNFLSIWHNIFDSVVDLGENVTVPKTFSSVFCGRVRCSVGTKPPLDKSKSSSEPLQKKWSNEVKWSETGHRIESSLLRSLVHRDLKILPFTRWPGSGRARGRSLITRWFRAWGA